ncbi:MAG TPA: TRAP transporter small permease [Rhabdaerophilum sp.]|nr:TRAP transporter small permease [Rhabdaerophilum sp.]
MRQTLRSISLLLSNIAIGASAIGLVGMTLAVSWQVFGRYVLNDSPAWTEPLSIQLMGWFILLGSAVGIRENYHLGFDVLRYMVPRRVARLMAIISMLVVLAFGAAMAVYSLDLVIGTWTATLPVLGWPGGTDFMPITFGGVLIVFFALEQLYLLVTDAPEAQI